MLRLGASEVRPAHRGEFRVLVAARRTGLGQVRAYLAADLLRRLSERSRLAPTVVDLLPDHENDLSAYFSQLNIHPPRHTLAPPVADDQLTGLFADGIREDRPVFDVGIRLAGANDPDAQAREGLAGHWIDVAGAAASGAVSAPAERLGHGEDPLAVRMMLMRHGYGEPLGDGGDPCGADLSMLAHWRELVALWARSPSGPLSRRYTDAVTAAFAADLDSAAALREMSMLADDPAEPDGVKFETFAAADMLLGLDLARDVGK